MIITVTSGKGGVGKSTTSTNLGVGLANQGKKVLLIDGDTGVSKLDIFLGLEENRIYNIVDVINKKCPIEKAIVSYPEEVLLNKPSLANLSLLPTSQIDDKSAIRPEDMMKICEELKDKYDFIIIDCPAGIEEGFKSSIAPCDLAVVVVVPELPSVRDADRVIGILEKENKNKTVVINKIDKGMVKKGDMLDIADIDEMLRTNILGIIPEDKNVGVFTNKGRAIIEDRKYAAGKAYSDVVGRLLGENIPVPSTYKESFLTRILNFLGIQKA